MSLLSIVIPAYNEAKRIKPSLDKILAYANTLDQKVEVIIVNDGSLDDTVAVAESIADPRVRVIGYEENKGKGYAVREGVRAAKGDYILFSDADLSTPIEEYGKLIRELTQKNADVAIGSRGMPESDISVPQPWYRQLAGRLFNVATRVITRLPYKDTQCGFKLYKASVAKDLFERMTIYRFGFDAEMLTAARCRKYSVVEVPVRWRNDKRTKVKFWRDGTRMLWNLVQTTYNAWKGVYD